MCLLVVLVKSEGTAEGSTDEFDQITTKYGDTIIYDF